MKSIVALAALAALSCASPSPPEAAPSHSGSTARSAPPVAPPPQSSMATLVARAVQRAAQQRGLEPLREVRYQTLPRAELVAKALETATRDTPASRIDGQAQFLIRLGLVPVDFDDEAAFGELLSDQLAAFYDPKLDLFYVSQDLDPQVNDVALVHELVHALQNQHFDLNRLLSAAQTSDEVAAIQTLAEGDATAAMLNTGDSAAILAAIAATAENPAKTNSETAVPGILFRSMLALYRDGLELVQKLRSTGDWSRVNALWLAPPKSTSLVLHPEQLQSPPRSEPLASPLPSPRGPSTVVYDDVIGEQGLIAVLEDWVPESQAQTAAVGWQSDRVTLFQDARAQGLVWRLRFERALDAEEARQAFAVGLLQTVSSSGEVELGRPTSTVRQPRFGCRERPDRGPIGLELHDRDLVITSWLDLAKPGKAACEHLRDWSRRLLASPEENTHPSDLGHK